MMAARLVAETHVPVAYKWENFNNISVCDKHVSIVQIYVIHGKHLRCMAIPTK